MLRIIELAALPSTLQLCLQSADRCGGLVRLLGCYVGVTCHPLKDDGAEHSATDVNALVAMGLLTCSDASNRLAKPTDAGIELLNIGYVRREVMP